MNSRTCRAERWLTLMGLALGSIFVVCAQTSQTPVVTTASTVPLQPFALQVRQIESALEYLGQPLSAAEQQEINDAIGTSDEAAAVARIQQVLDKHTLAIVDINPESRVQVRPGSAKPELVELGTRVFLVKVLNRAGVTSRLTVESPNSGPVYIQSDTSPEPPMKLTSADVKERWADISLYDKNPISERLSGLRLEYRILQVYSQESGQRSAKLGFDVGQGTQDIGFRNEIVVLFNALPSHRVKLHVKDEKGAPAMAAFTVRDSLNRLYPNPSKRLAPDLFFQPQVYRADGETIVLPEGSYTVTSWMGPEYHPQTKKVTVGKEASDEISVNMQRWIDPSRYGWYSGDHHVHAAGCSHYQNPSEGVRPEHMMRQVRGEKLNVGSVLTWGPCYYYQKQFFSGKDDPNSRSDELMHYDLEVSGFPSSHAGHLVLLGLTEQDYTGTKRIEDWPTWDLPILRWAKAQNAVVGFAHSGWGLEVKADQLPNYEMPGFDGIGANEYIVDVTYPDTVDFISSVDTPYVWELNIWYQTLNVGFRTRVSGETDFPCITDNRVGQGRVYAKMDGGLAYRAWVDALREGRSYVSDGRSHLMDFSVNGVAVGTKDSEVRLTGAGTAHVTVKAAAYLDPLLANPREHHEDDPPNWAAQLPAKDRSSDDPFFVKSDSRLNERPYDERPYWHIERARIGTTREVPLELVVNGRAVARKNIVADGNVHQIAFDVPIDQSSWMAVRILPSSHSNPMFVIVDGKPIRASRASAQWCLTAVNQCWAQKAPKISKAELPDAQKAYEHAREVYRKLISECER
ncbi:MAG: CehA/McbA family metallohydrolase [Bryobacteraceae bacterium]